MHHPPPGHPRSALLSFDVREAPGKRLRAVLRPRLLPLLFGAQEVVGLLRRVHRALDVRTQARDVLCRGVREVCPGLLIWTNYDSRGRGVVFSAFLPTQFIKNNELCKIMILLFSLF